MKSLKLIQQLNCYIGNKLMFVLQPGKYTFYMLHKLQKCYK